MEFNIKDGTIKLFKIAGITVFLHWSWLLIAVYEIGQRRGEYSSILWNIAEYVGLFMIVLLHEFGHATACRQVGGRADRILLWPLGGVAYVSPPYRPGAMLWSIVAGPLVNVILFPIFWAAITYLRFDSLPPDVYFLFRSLSFLNILLLVFNLLPIYPLDGGQILRSLLWFLIGPDKSLRVASVIGLLGALGLAAYGIYSDSIWLLIMAFFIGSQCFAAFKSISKRADRLED